jgi:hypothetical protein
VMEIESYRGIFGDNGVGLSEDELLRGIYRLYLEGLYSVLLAGGLSVDELVKLGRVVVPLCNIKLGSGLSVDGNVSGFGGNSLLRVIDGVG